MRSLGFYHLLAVMASIAEGVRPTASRRHDAPKPYTCLPAQIRRLKRPSPGRTKIRSPARARLRPRSPVASTIASITLRLNSLSLSGATTVIRYRPSATRVTSYGSNRPRRRPYGSSSAVTAIEPASKRRYIKHSGACDPHSIRAARRAEPFDLDRHVRPSLSPLRDEARDLQIDRPRADQDVITSRDHQPTPTAASRPSSRSSARSSIARRSFSPYGPVAPSIAGYRDGKAPTVAPRRTPPFALQRWDASSISPRRAASAAESILLPILISAANSMSCSTRESSLDVIRPHRTRRTP